MTDAYLVKCLMKIMSSLFNCTDTPHLKFHEVHKVPSKLPGA